MSDPIFNKRDILTIGLGIFLLLVVASTSVHAASLNPFSDDFIVNGMSKSLQSLQVFFTDFLSLILDIFSILLFILWIAIIVSIIYGIYYVTTIPKQLGAENLQDALMMIGHSFWRFIR